MSDKPTLDEPTNDPSYVFKRTGLYLMVIGAILGCAVSMGLIYVLGTSGIQIENKYLLGFLALSTFGIVALILLMGFMLVSDKFRDAVLEWAHNSKWVPLQKKAPTPEPEGQ